MYPKKILILKLKLKHATKTTLTYVHACFHCLSAVVIYWLASFLVL